mgnify:CR=1 FL=1
MPKSNLVINTKEVLCERLANFVYGELKRKDMTITELAEKMAYTPQNVSKKLRNASFNYTDFCFFVREFQPDNDTLRYIIGI